MKLLSHDFRHLVMVIITSLETKETKSISFIETNLEEVIKLVIDNIPLRLDGEKVRIFIRENHPEKQWGKSKCFTSTITSIDDAINKIKNAV